MKMFLTRSLLTLLFTPITLFAQEQKEKDTPVNGTNVKKNAEKSVTEKVSIKIIDPKTIHDHFINNLVDAAAVAVQDKKLTPKGRIYLSDTLLNLAEDEKEGNKHALIGDSAEKINLIIEKFGAEKAKPTLEGAIAKLLSMDQRVVTYKEEGVYDEFLAILQKSMVKSVDAVSGKDKGENVAKAKVTEKVDPLRVVDAKSIKEIFINSLLDVSDKLDEMPTKDIRLRDKRVDLLRGLALDEGKSEGVFGKIADKAQGFLDAGTPKAGIKSFIDKSLAQLALDYSKTDTSIESVQKEFVKDVRDAASKAIDAYLTINKPKKETKSK